MFYCEITGQLSEPSESPVFVVVEKRRKEYFGIKPKRRRGKSFKTRNRKNTGPIERIGSGWEIAKVIRVRRSTIDRLEQEGKTIECRWV